MATLQDVQNEVKRQVIRDYGSVAGTAHRAMCVLGLAEEAGEVAGLMKRVIRDFPKDRERATREKFVEEMGDVLWYLAACCTSLDITLDEIWDYNVNKLQERYGK